MIVATEALNEFKKDVLARYPEEACGLIVGPQYHACKNTADNPKENFRIDAKERMHIENTYGHVDAVMHSHPYDIRTSKHFLTQHYNPVWPSLGDQQSFIADDVPWGIVATDGKGFSEINWLDDSVVAPFERREFNWFTADCYSCVRDWHKLNTGIVLPNVARGWNFWERQLNTIEDGIRSIPYATKHPVTQAQTGDMAVFTIGPFKVVNHLGVVSGNNEFLHQWLGQYCHTTRWDLWKHKAAYVVRFANVKNN